MKSMKLLTAILVSAVLAPVTTNFVSAQDQGATSEEGAPPARKRRRPTRTVEPEAIVEVVDTPEQEAEHAADAEHAAAAEQAVAADAEPVRHHYEPDMGTGTSKVTIDPRLWGPDPVYDAVVYDPSVEKKIYGAKTAIEAPRPVFEWGYNMYSEGPLGHTNTLFGELNPTRQQLLVYGDLRTVAAYNDVGSKQIGVTAARLNLDVDYRITATERIHAFFQPLDDGANFTRYEFHNSETGESKGFTEFDARAETLFFEGELGSIMSGFTGEYTSYDLPIALGLMPLFMQNGIWMDDEFYGLAVAVVAQNSPKLDISNYDISFFAGFDEVESRAFVDEEGKIEKHAAQIFGISTYLDIREAYLEAGIAYLDDKDTSDGDHSYTNITLAYTRRYGGWLSNSVRLIGNVGQDPGNGREKTADGYALLIENSLITSLPSTLVPYFNFYVGKDSPQAAAKIDGLLKNTGINFETDTITGFPRLDDTAHDTWGGAIGLEYLFQLNKQIVVELAAVQSENKNIPDQNALGIRFQKPLTKRWIFRTDAMYGWVSGDRDNISGIRFEMRMKM